MELVFKIKPRDVSRKRDDYFSLPCNKNDDTDIKSFNNSYFSNIKKDLKLREYAKGRSKCSPNDFSSSLSKKLNNSRNQRSQFSNVVLNNAIKKDDSSINNIALLTCNTKFTTTTLTEKVFYETSNLHRQDENINKKRSTFRLKFKGFQRTKQSPLKNSHELPLRKEIDHENDTNKSINIRFNLPFLYGHEERDISCYNQKEILDKSLEKLEKLKEKVISDNKTKLIINKIKILKPIIIRNAKNKFTKKKRLENNSSELINFNSFNKKIVNSTSENVKSIDKKILLNRVMKNPNYIKVKNDFTLENKIKEERSLRKRENEHPSFSEKNQLIETLRKRRDFFESFNKNNISSNPFNKNYSQITSEKNEFFNKESSMRVKIESFTQTYYDCLNKDNFESVCKQKNINSNCKIYERVNKEK